MKTKYVQKNKGVFVRLDEQTYKEVQRIAKRCRWSLAGTVGYIVETYCQTETSDVLQRHTRR